MMAKLLSKPFGLFFDALGAMLGRNLFKQLWYGATGERVVPSATNRDLGWGELIVAATIRGAIFAVVRTIVKRAGALGYQRVTGSWPGEVSAKDRREV
jgi:hypothetical protein